ncbi:hypothetical protein CTI14_30195, partial [Methylobacterium radiotolerans]
MTAAASAVTHRTTRQFTEAFAQRLVTHLNHLRQESHPDDPARSRWTTCGGRCSTCRPCSDLQFWTVEDDAGIHA